MIKEPIAKTRRYYWIKLRTDFIYGDTFDFLITQGAEYALLYIKLLARVINTNGELCYRVGEVMMKYDIGKIVQDFPFIKKDQAALALDLYKRLGLIYEGENDFFVVTDFDRFVGSENESAERVRKMRSKARQKQIEAASELTPELSESNNPVTETLQ